MIKIELFYLTEEYIALIHTTSQILTESSAGHAKNSLNKLSERFAKENELEFQWTVCENDWILFFSYMAALNKTKCGITAEGSFRNILVEQRKRYNYPDFPDERIKMLFPKKKKRRRK